MTKRLFEVSWHGRCYVMAESAAKARSIALREACDPVGAGLEAQAYPPCGHADDWGSSLPFGGDDPRTVGEILAAEAAAQEEIPRV